jgi:hypothetical protein
MVVFGHWVWLTAIPIYRFAVLGDLLAFEEDPASRVKLSLPSQAHGPAVDSVYGFTPELSDFTARHERAAMCGARHGGLSWLCLVLNVSVQVFFDDRADVEAEI